MKIFNIIYFLVGYPYFFIQGILSSVIAAAIQSYMAYKLEKFPWQISIEDTMSYIEEIQDSE